MARFCPGFVAKLSNNDDAVAAWKST